MLDITHTEYAETGFTYLLGAYGKIADTDEAMKHKDRLRKVFEECICSGKTDIEIKKWWEENGAVFEKKDTVDNVFYDPHILTNIPFVSFCEHHWMPFSGLVHIAYTRENGVVGLSKIPRLINEICLGTSLQEYLTQRIARLCGELFEATSVAVVLEAQHTCVACRGVKISDTTFITTAAYTENNCLQNADWIIDQLNRRISYAKK